MLLINLYVCLNYPSCVNPYSQKTSKFKLDIPRHTLAWNEELLWNICCVHAVWYFCGFRIMKRNQFTANVSKNSERNFKTHNNLNTNYGYDSPTTLYNVNVSGLIKSCSVLQYVYEWTHRCRHFKWEKLCKRRCTGYK